MTDNPERALIGMALASPKAFQSVETIVDPADFADIRYEALWGLIASLNRDGRPHDPLNVSAALKSIPEELRRGIDELEIAAIYGEAPIGLAYHYGKIVAGNATARRLEAAGTRIVQLARNATHDELQGVIDNARSEIDNAGKVVTDVKHFSDILTRLLDNADKAPEFTPTPWADVNELIGGWRPGCLYVIGARPGVGKSVLGIQAGLDLSARGVVAFSTLEMTDEEVAERVVSQRANVPFSHLKDHKLNETDWTRIGTAQGALSNLGFYVDDKATVGPVQIRAHARTVARRGKLAGIVVDYLQLMTPGNGDKRSRQEIVSDFSRQLKIMAKEFEVPVIALSQLNRQSTARQDPRPSISDLRESGAVEQDADVVMLLHSTEDHPEILEVGVAKNRHGQRGSVELTFEGAYQRAVDKRWTPHRAAS